MFSYFTYPPTKNSAKYYYFNNNDYFTILSASQNNWHYREYYTYTHELSYNDRRQALRNDCHFGSLPRQSETTRNRIVIRLRTRNSVAYHKTIWRIFNAAILNNIRTKLFYTNFSMLLVLDSIFRQQNRPKIQWDLLSITSFTTRLRNGSYNKIYEFACRIPQSQKI